MNNIILTSRGFSIDNVKQYVKKLIDTSKISKCAIITTASDGKENNKYSILTKQQLHDLGLEDIIFFDLENCSNLDALSDVDMIYVCGGNTYKLLKYVKESDFDTFLKEYLSNGNYYLGVSAGSCILGQDISNLEGMDMDENIVNLQDTTGIKIIDRDISPHHEDKYNEFLANSPISFLTIRNEEAFVADMNGNIESI